MSETPLSAQSSNGRPTRSLSPQASLVDGAGGSVPAQASTPANPPRSLSPQKSSPSGVLSGRSRSFGSTVPKAQSTAVSAAAEFVAHGLPSSAVAGAARHQSNPQGTRISSI